MLHPSQTAFTYRMEPCIRDTLNSDEFMSSKIDDHQYGIKHHITSDDFTESLLSQHVL